MTRVNISKHPQANGFKLASIDVPVIVGDVPGSISVRCAHPSAVGALAACAHMAQHLATDPTVGAVVPEGTLDDLATVHSIALAARAGYPTLHAMSLDMPKGQRKLCKALASEARQYGGPDDDEAAQVGGFFDSIENLAKSVVNSVVDYGDPDHWPQWMKNLAKPVGRAALDAAAVAVFGPAGPAAVETMIHVVDQAQAGDPKAQQQLQDIAQKALNGDKKAKVLMSAVHEADASKDEKADAAPVNSKSKELAVTSKTAGMDWAGVGDAFDDYMAQYGAAYDPNTWAGADQAYEASSPSSTYMDEQFANAAEDSGYGYQDVMPQYGPVYMPQYAAQPYPPYGYGDPYAQGYAPQLPQQQAPQLSPDGTMWFNVDHWERVPAGGLPQQQAQQYGDQQGYGDPYAQGYGYPQPGQPAGFDANGWPFDASGQPWPQDANGQPMDPSQAQPQQGAATAPNVRTGASSVIRGAGARGGGVTVTAGPRRGTKGSGSFAGARDSRSGSSGAKPAGFGWAGSMTNSMAQQAAANAAKGRDHRSGR